MPARNRAARAQIFAALHVRGAAFILPNNWDGASARLLEAAGFPALGTSSAGVAYALGYPDGQRIGLDDVCRLLESTVRVVRIPVSVDFEAGFGGSVAEVVRNVALISKLGAVGINLEDRDPHTGEMVPLEEQSARIREIVANQRKREEPLYLNARTDIYLGRIGEAQKRFERSVERARAYLAAGASGIFVPGVGDEPTIGALTKAIDAPLNVLASAALPALATLRGLGVARISTGSAPFLRTYQTLREISAELREAGTFTFIENAIPFAEMKALLEGS